MEDNATKLARLTMELDAVKRTKKNEAKQFNEQIKELEEEIKGLAMEMSGQ